MTPFRLALALLTIGGFFYLINASDLSSLLASVKIGAALNTENEPTSGLVGHYTFDGPDINWADTTTEIKDVTGTAGHGNALGSLGVDSLVQGRLGQGMSFDKNNLDYIQLPARSFSGTFTVTAWAYREEGVADYVFVLSRDNHCASGRSWTPFRFFINSSGTFYTRVSKSITCSGGSAGDTYTTNSNVFTNGTWHHVAVSVTNNSSDSRQVKYYIDGVLTPSSQVQNEANTWPGEDSNQRTLIGARWSQEAVAPTGYMTGKLDDVRIYNRALSEAEINALYHMTGSVETTKTVVANDSLQTGLVGHWTFDGPDVDWASSTAEIEDVSGGGHHGDATTTMSAATSPTIGVLGQAMEFDGLTDYIDLSANATAFDDTGPATYSAWVRSSNDVGQSILTLVDTAGINRYLQVKLGPVRATLTDELVTVQECVAGVCSSGSGVTLGYATTNRQELFDGFWHHLAVTWDQSSTKIYLDGVSKTVTVGGGTDDGIYAQVASIDEVYIGVGQNGVVKGSYAEADIDDVRVYDRALSADEVARLYQFGGSTKVNTTIKPAASPLEQGLVGHWTFDGPDVRWQDTTSEVKDVSGQGNHGDAIGNLGVQSPVSGALGQAMSFDGVANYVDAGTHAAVDTIYTVAGWVNITPDVGTGRVIRRGNSSYCFYNPDISVDQSGISFAESGCSGSGIIGTVSVAVGEWHHFALTRNESVAKVYVDGALEITDGSQPDPDGVGSGRVLVGASWHAVSGLSNFLNGSVDDLRIYDRELSAEEVETLYQLGR